MTPAEELRAAAAILRETAKEWLAYAPDHPRTGKWYEVGSLAEALDVHVGTPFATADEAWIVLAGPALAEPLAVWLGQIAERLQRITDGQSYLIPDCKDDALAVARVINGSGS